MPSINFKETRNVHLTTIDYIRTGIASSWTGVTVVRSFQEAYLDANNLPIICVEVSDVNHISLEIGDTASREEYLVTVDLFAKSEPMVQDLGDSIYALLQTGWDYYKYSTTTAGVVSSTLSGFVSKVRFVNDSRVRLGDSAASKDQHRRVFTMTVRASELP